MADKAPFQFEQIGLGSILKQNQLFVPPNQRDYAWTDVEVTKLLQDFARAINEGDYFVGTIVTIPRAEGTLEVVDGQQRLATTAILLASIRDYLVDRDEPLLVESINNQFLGTVDRTKRERVPTLKLNVGDHDLFSQIISGNLPVGDANALRTSHQLLIGAKDEAQKHVHNIVATLDAKDHGDLLNHWISFIEHKALVVLLRVPDDADAFKMFETLNGRGVPTSQADLIKNYLFGRAGDRRDEAEARWAYMRGALESLEEEDITVDFLRHALIVQYGFLREAQVYDRVQEVVKSEQAAISFTSVLENLANVYVATFNAEHERWNGYPAVARRGIETFNLLNIRPMRPLLLAIAARLKEKDATAALQFLVSLSVRLLIAASTRSASVEIPLANAAKDVFSGDVSTADQLRSTLSSVMPSDAEFQLAFETARVSNARLGRYLLRSLEMAAKDEPEPWFVPTDDGSVINLEHVAPKKPEGNWPTFDDDTLNIYSNRIGNLALMRASDNSAARSDPFTGKRPIYANSPYELTRHIGELDDWTADAIVDRQKTLAALAVKTWPGGSAKAS